MDLQLIDDDLLSGDDVDWLESQFFTQATLRHHDLDWGPVAPMPLAARRAMHATFGLLAVAVIGLLTFVIYSKLIMPTPEPLGTAQPVLPPMAASASAPKG